MSTRKKTKNDDQVTISRAEQVSIEIRDRILRGEFEPGFHLQEIPLAESLGVSRTPVHEALVTLAQEGLLEPGPKRGFKVRVFTADDIRNAYDVRAILEGLAARLVAERDLSNDVQKSLQHYLRMGDQMLLRGAFTRNDQDEWLEMNNGFHMTIVRAANNPMLASFVEAAHQVPLASARHVHWYRYDRDNFELAKRAHQAHHEIYDALSNREASSAEALMREHITFSRRLLVRHLSERVGQPISATDTIL